MAVFSYFFYRSVLPMLPGILLIWKYYEYRRKQFGKKRIEVLEQQFKETLLSVETNLQAGYSMENAFLESYQDIERLFGAKSDMAQELLRLKRGMQNGKSLEALLWDLGKRCPDSELEEFADIYSIAGRTGGRWSETIQRITSYISQKLEMKQEIEILIHGKKLEGRIMCMIPFFILFYMNLTSPGYFDALYHQAGGIVIMTGCLGAYIAAYLWMEKVTEVHLR